MKHLSLFVPLILLAACGIERDFTGTSRTLAPEQVIQLERSVEADFSGIAAAHGRRFVEGKVVARADGEVISCRPVTQAAKRGLLRAGGTEVEGGEAELIITGELNVNGMQAERRTERRYVLELKLVDLKTRSVLYVQRYTVTNRHEQERWK